MKLMPVTVTKKMENVPLLPNLSSDRPILSSAEDALGRGSFAAALSNAFLEWQGDDSLVVALYGPWGSGKSSLKNMTLELMRCHQEHPAIIDFNPWVWSGRDRLFSAFFEEVGIAIGGNAESKEAKGLASKWRKYGARLSFAGNTLSVLKKSAEALGLPYVPSALEAASAATKQITDVTEGAAKTFESAIEVEPFDELKRSLTDSLSSLKTPLLIVMDDVDRLSKDEVRTLFQLIKVNADFPKVVYFLLFDRAIIEKALDGEGGSSGGEYMEKIVQVGFDMPKHDQNDLDLMIGHGLNSILGFPGADRTHDQDRWAELHHFGIRPILATPRDVKRFLSSMSFTVGLFYREHTLEVNVVDLIGIEILRIFEPELYHQLPAHRQLLLGGGSAHTLSRDSKQARKDDFEKLLARASERNRKPVQAILKELFPSIDWLLMGYGHGQGFEPVWLRNLRICHEDFFDRYFAMAISKRDLPVSVVDRLISRSNDRVELRRELTALEESGRLVDALNRLEAFTLELDMKYIVPFITAIMDVGDSLPDRGAGLFGVGPDMTAYFLIYNYLARESDHARRSAFLLKALSDTTGLYLPTQIVSLDAQRREKKDGSNPLLPDDQTWIQAKKICLNRLKKASEDGNLMSPKLNTYLWRWKELAGDNAPRKFVNSLTSTLQGTLMFLRAFTVDIRSQVVGTMTIRVSQGLDLKELGSFANISRIKTKLKPLLEKTISPEFSEIATEYAKELTAFRAALDA